MKPVLVHVGYHKTGTTWLQRFLFKNAAVGFANPFDEYRDIQGRLVHVNSLDFDANACRSFFKDGIERTHDAGLLPVVSAERLCGSIFFGGYDSKELADRLRAVLPEACVLIVIREQCRMILSSYKQYVRAGGACTLAHFLEPPRQGGTVAPGFRLEHFRYHRLVGHYQRLFGPRRVLVLPYEWFCAEPMEYVSRIAAFCDLHVADEALRLLPFGERENESLHGTSLALKRRLNFFVRDRLNPWALFGIQRKSDVLGCLRGIGRCTPRLNGRLEERARSFIATRVGDYYRDSNHATMEITGWDLSRWGYAVSRPDGMATRKAGRYLLLPYHAITC